MKIQVTRIIGTLLLVVALSPVHGVWAGAPTDQLRDGVDRVTKILGDPELKGREKASQRRAAIGKVAGDIFDFGEMAKRSMGQHWDSRTPAERVDFARLFTDLIQRSYISKVDQSESRKMTFLGETIDGDHAVVRTAIILSQGQMPIDYRMHATGERWRVYDLGLDGVSLVANYRAQFNKIIRTSSFATLVARLASNQAEFAPAASPSGGKAGR
jgi:phospholipid transport system substrate-binding protein